MQRSAFLGAALILSAIGCSRSELDALGTAGTINQGSNPVDWTRLRNVPAVFADGSDDGGAVDFDAASVKDRRNS